MENNKSSKIVELLISNGMNKEKAPDITKEIYNIIFPSESTEQPVDEFFQEYIEAAKKNPVKPIYPDLFK